ncbi:hypothetical protein BOX15_Mlig018640g2 [Macrostomum lignano]|uniref:GATOR complex protein NPRL3 n=1 Tax=Macrostomum lignano TaxID=282301 RepID=A0A267G182_9PLAT|nr:hypothetical protein BOX15_Mlig018640g2 [Macrostomum lignano]
MTIHDGTSYARWGAGQLDPISIFLVTSGSTGDRLLFRYPPLPLASSCDASAAQASRPVDAESAAATAAAAAAAASSPSKSSTVNSVGAAAGSSSIDTGVRAGAESAIASSSSGANAMAAAAAAAAASAAASSDLLDSDAAAISSQFSLLVRTQPTCSSLHTANGNGAGNGSAGTGNQPEVTVCLRDEALASILSAKAVMTQRAFEIKVDDVVFLGYSESLAAGAVGVSNKGDSSCPASIPDAGSTASSTGSGGSGSPQQRRKSAAGSSSISTFCIIFAVRCCAPKSINKLYIQLARQLTTALRHEEQRCKFLHAQQELINQLMAELEDARQQRRQILDRLNERSQLCRSLTSVFCQLRRGGRVSLRLNGWLPISFCLAHKMHRLAGRCYVLPSLVESCLMSLQPYHCVLPLTDYSSSSNNPLEAGANGGLTYSDLPMDCNPLMSRFLRALSPQKSLLDIRLETDMAYSVALEFARHLVRWGCAIICHPVTDANVYVLNPRLDVLLEESPDLVADYQNQCSSHSQSMPSLAEVLAAFSLHAPLGDLRDREQAADLPLGLLTWLLRRRLLLQLHTYVTFLPDPVDVADATFGCIDDGLSPNPLPQLPARLRDRLSPPVQLTIQRLPQSSEPADLELLADAVDLLELDSSRSCHIEHLAHHLGRHRTQIVALVDKFQPILVTTLLPDRACQAFFGLS